MKFVPLVFGEQALGVTLGLLDGFAVREIPTVHQPMDVGVDREGRHPKRLAHYHRRGLVSHAWQGFEGVKILRHVAPVLLDEDAAEFGNGGAFPGGQPARTDDVADRVDLLPHHRARVVGEREKLGRHRVNPGVGALRREQHGHEQGVRVGVFQRHRRLRVQCFKFLNHPFDTIRFGKQGVHGFQEIVIRARSPKQIA